MVDTTPEAQEMPSLPKTSVVDAYLERVNQLLDADPEPRELALALVQRLGSRHSLSLLETASEMDRLYREMRSVLDEFTGRPFGLFTVLTIEHLALVMKLYVISWYTMLDLVARLVSIAFNLGIADRDINLKLILNNDHVKSSRVHAILEDYERTIVIKDLRKRRNDAVHRGRIPDPDVEGLLKERNTIDARRYSLLESRPISDDEHKTRLSALQSRLSTLAQAKRRTWETVHGQTVSMTSAVAREVADKTLQLYRHGAI